MLKDLDSNNLLDFNKIMRFIRENTNSDYMQDIKWNVIRNEEQKYYLFFEEDNEIIWICNLLEKEKNNEKYLYAPRGPILKNSDKNLLNHFLKNIKFWMNERNYKKIVINPYLNYSDLDIISKDYKYIVTEHNDYQNLLDSCKLAVMNIDDNEEELIKKLPSKFRQNTRRSYRKNLRSKISKNVDLVNFYKLYLETAQRHEFNPHTIDYFGKLVSIYKDDLIFIEVWHENIPLAMSIDIIFNNKLIYLYGVSSEENRNLLGMYNLQWEAIKYCIKNNIPQYDFGGVFSEEEDYENKDYGLYKFKKGYCYDGFKDVVPDITFDFGG